MKIQFLPDPRTIPFFHPAVKAARKVGNTRGQRRYPRWLAIFHYSRLLKILVLHTDGKEAFTPRLDRVWPTMNNRTLEGSANIFHQLRMNDAREASRDITYANVCVIRIVYTAKGIVYDGQGSYWLHVIRIITYC